MGTDMGVRSRPCGGSFKATLNCAATAVDAAVATTSLSVSHASLKGHPAKLTKHPLPTGFDEPSQQTERTFPVYRIEYFEPHARWPGQARSIGRTWQVVARVSNPNVADRVMRSVMVSRPDAQVRIRTTFTQERHSERCIERARVNGDRHGGVTIHLGNLDEAWRVI